MPLNVARIATSNSFQKYSSYFSSFNKSRLASLDQREYSTLNGDHAQISTSLSMFTNDIDECILDHSSTLQEKVNNLLSWNQVCLLTKSTYSHTKVHNIQLKYAIHGFLNSVILNTSEIERLDFVQLLAYVFTHEDSFSVGERVIRILRSHEQIRNVFLLTKQEKSLLIYRMLSLSTNTFRVAILSSLVKLFFLDRENRQKLNLNIKSIEYQHLTIARAIFHFLKMKGSILDEYIMEILFSSYRDYLSAFHTKDDRHHVAAVHIPISEFITGYLAISLNGLIKENVIVSIIDCFLMSLSLKGVSASNIPESDRVFLEEMINRVKGKPFYNHHLSRFSLSSSVFLDIVPYNPANRLINHVALGFTSAKLPLQTWIDKLQNFNSESRINNHAYLLACSHIGSSRLPEITEADIRKQVSLILGPKMLPFTIESIAPLLSLSSLHSSLLPFTLSLLSSVVEYANDNENHRFRTQKAVRSWLSLEIIQLATSDPQVSFLDKKTTKLTLLTSWFRRSSLYKGRVDIIDKLQPENIDVDKFIHNLSTCGGIHLSSIGTILNLSSNFLHHSRIPSLFIDLLDSHVWINIISHLWKRKRYMSIVDFYRLFIIPNIPSSSLNEKEHVEKNAPSILIPSTRFRYIPNSSVSSSDECHIDPKLSIDQDRAPLDMLNEFKSSLFSSFSKPNSNFINLFVIPLIQNTQNIDPSESILALDLQAKLPINDSYWTLSSSYRQFYQTEFLDTILLSLLIKSEWRLLIGLTIYLKKVLPRSFQTSRVITRIRSYIPLALKYTCGIPYLDPVLENDHFIKFSPTKTLDLQQELGSSIEFVPTHQPDFPDRPYFLIEFIPENRVAPCKIPCLPDTLSLQFFCTILSLTHWGPFSSDNRLCDKTWFLSILPPNVQSVGSLRSLIFSQGCNSSSLFSKNELNALQLLLFTVHIRSTSGNFSEQSHFD